MTAGEYFSDGFNCSQCVLKAALGGRADCVLGACSGVCAGFGVGAICGAAVAGVIILGVLFDEDSAIALRIAFLAEFSQKFGGLDCSKLKDSLDCEKIVDGTVDILERLIDECEK